MKKCSRAIENLVQFFLPLGLMFQVLGFGGSLYWVLDIFSHGQGQFFLLGVFGLLSALFLRSLKLFSLSVCSLILSVSALLPLYYPSSVADEQGEELRVLSLNVLTSNTHYEEVSHYIHDAHPDVLLLVEVSDEWVKALEPSLTEYQHRYLMPRPDNFGMALYSRYPLEEAKKRFFGGASTPALTAQIMTPQQKVSFYGVHTYPPLSAYGTSNRNRLLRALVAEAQEVKGPQILAGDLNTSRWGMIMRELLPLGVFRDSADGRGYHATWFGGDGLVGLPIDMVLVSPDFTVQGFEVGPDVGSDHRGVLTRLRLGH